MDIIISNNTAKPIYEQITSQIKGHIMAGRLQTGEPLPSMRALARELHVSVITVQKAYEDLQRDGFIETVVGRGSFVAAPNRDFIVEEQRRQVEKYLEQAADLGRSAGLSLNMMQVMLRIYYQEEK